MFISDESLIDWHAKMKIKMPQVYPADDKKIPHFMLCLMTLSSALAYMNTIQEREQVTREFDNRLKCV